MTLDDLNRLKLALDTRDFSFYHGDLEHALGAVVDELFALHRALRGYSSEDLDSFTLAAEELEEAKAHIAQLEAVLRYNFKADTSGITGKPIKEGWVAELTGTGITVWGPTEYAATMLAYNLRRDMLKVLF